MTQERVQSGEQYLGYARVKLALLEEERVRAGVDSLRRVYHVDGATITLVADTSGGSIHIEGVETAGFLCQPRKNNVPNPFPLTEETSVQSVSRDVEEKKWEREKLTAAAYGNIDWRGVLSWRGPNTRYFPHDRRTPIDGYTMVEDEDDEGFIYTVFGLDVYSGGEVVGKAPGGSAYILGAGLHGNQLVAIIAEKVPREGFFHKLMYQNYGSASSKMYHEKDAPEGWREVWRANLGRGQVPWFFNSDCTSAVSVFNGTIHRLSVNIEQGSATYTSAPASTAKKTITGGQNFTQTNEVSTHPGDAMYTMGYPGGCVDGTPVDAMLDAATGKGVNEVGYARYRVDYSGEEVIGIDYDGDDREVQVKLRQRGYEESRRDATSRYGVFRKTFFMPPDQLSNYDPASLHPTLTLDAEQSSCDATIGVSSTGLCAPVFTASDGEVTQIPGASSATIEIHVGGCDPCGNNPEVVRAVTVTGTGCGGDTAVKIHTFTFPEQIITPLVLTVTAIDANSASVSASGGRLPYTFSVDKGSIDDVHSGGTWSFAGQCGTGVVSVTDACGIAASKPWKMPGGSFKNPVTYGYDYHAKNAAWGYYCDCYGAPGFGLPDFTSPDGLTRYTAITGTCNRSDGADWRCAGLSNQLVIPDYPMTFCDGGDCPYNLAELITGYTKRTWSC